MEAVGRLAGGIAHDFNNLLTVITSYSDLVLEELALDDPKRDDVEQIRKAAQGAAALTRHLLAFSRQEVLEPQILDLKATVTGTKKLLRRLIGADVEVTTSLAPDLGAVKADPGQLEQIIINLAINARDAMPEGGRLAIDACNVENAPARPGRYVMLALSDTGIGMDDETKARIFEPFFTTKESGKGTGLGLATVYGIVKRAGGFISVESEPGRGTSFKIYLPRVDEPIAPAVTLAAAAEPRRGTETVLVVEDAASVRVVTRQVLERYGYVVLEAPNGETALRLAAKHHGPIQLLVTDVIMPGLSGRQLAGQLAPLRPEMKVLYVSGYADDVESGVAYLQKPFTPQTLARRVRAALDASPHGGAHPGRRRRCAVAGRAPCRARGGRLRGDRGGRRARGTAGVPRARRRPPARGPLHPRAGRPGGHPVGAGRGPRREDHRDVRRRPSEARPARGR